MGTDATPDASSWKLLRSDRADWSFPRALASVPVRVYMGGCRPSSNAGTRDRRGAGGCEHQYRPSKVCALETPRGSV